MGRSLNHSCSRTGWQQQVRLSQSSAICVCVSPQVRTAKAWGCDKGCGYESFDRAEVVAHELNCHRKVAGQATPRGGSKGRDISV